MTAAREENARAEGGSTTGLEGQGLTAAAKVEVGGGLWFSFSLIFYIAMK
jgi:hypothetical protein